MTTIKEFIEALLSLSDERDEAVQRLDAHWKSCMARGDQRGEDMAAGISLAMEALKAMTPYPFSSQRRLFEIDEEIAALKRERAVCSRELERWRDEEVSTREDATAPTIARN